MGHPRHQKLRFVFVAMFQWNFECLIVLNSRFRSNLCCFAITERLFHQTFHFLPTLMFRFFDPNPKFVKIYLSPEVFKTYLPHTSNIS